MVRRRVNPNKYERKAISEFEKKRKSGKVKFEHLDKIEKNDPVAFVEEFVSVPRKVKELDISAIKRILGDETTASRRHRNRSNTFKLKKLQRKTKVLTTKEEGTSLVKKDRA